MTPVWLLSWPPIALNVISEAGLIVLWSSRWCEKQHGQDIFSEILSHWHKQLAHTRLLHLVNSIGFSTISRLLKMSLLIVIKSLWKKGIGEMAKMLVMVACGEDSFGLPGVYRFFCGRPPTLAIQNDPGAHWTFTFCMLSPSSYLFWGIVLMTAFFLWKVDNVAARMAVWGWMCTFALTPNISCRSIYTDIALHGYCWNIPFFFSEPPQTRHSVDRAKICSWQSTPSPAIFYL